MIARRSNTSYGINSKREKLRFGMIILGITVFLSYVYFGAHSFIAGPQIEVTYPSSGETLEETLISVRGNARNISSLELNGRPIFTNENGTFEESLLLSYGYNIIVLSAKDRFGRSIIKNVHILLK